MQTNLFYKVETAKPKILGIPYMGSKRKIAYELISAMLKVKPQAKYFYDVCGGGGAMNFTATLKICNTRLF
jgi:hypothetical protein